MTKIASRPPCWRLHNITSASRRTCSYGTLRLKRSNMQMSANIQVPEDRDAKITRLEKKVGEMGDMRIGMMDTDRRLKES